MGNRRPSIEDILADHWLKEEIREVPIMRRTFIIFFWFVAVLFGIMAVRFLYLGAVRHSFYEARAIRNISDITIEPAPRGEIRDRFGEVFVKNDHSYNAYLLPRFLPKDAAGRTEALAKISETVGLDNEELRKKLETRDWQFSDRVLLVSDLKQDELVAVNSARLPGVKIESGFKRVHEEPFVFSNLSGYTGLVGSDDLKNNEALVPDDEIGRAGLELQYDAALRGKNGEDITFKNALGRMQDTRITHDPEPGNALETFIDKDLQEFFHNRLSQTLKDLGRNVGIGIAINPQNGEVLALVGVPGFDASNIADYLNSKNQVLFNRATGGNYNPGSTIKPLVALAALKEGVITPEKQIYSSGSLEVPNPYHPDLPSRFLDWKAHGWVDVSSALARSSNVYFYEVGGGFGSQPGLGISRLKAWWQKFLLDRKTNIDMPGEAVGFLPDPEWKEAQTSEPWRLGDTYNVTIGQGDFSITPIGLVNYISAIANGGVLYQPRIMERIVAPDGTVVEESTSTVLSDMRKEFQAAIPYIQGGMRDAVTESYGTAHLLSSIPMSIAGKTGSAQVENNAKTNAFFVGYAPFENPEIAILVLIENSREGSSNTIPVARDVLMWYYQNRLQK